MTTDTDTDDAYREAVAGLDDLTDAYGAAMNRLVDAHWTAVAILVAGECPEAVAVRVTPWAVVVAGRARLLFDAVAVLGDGSVWLLPVGAGGRLDRHLRAIYGLAGADEYDHDHRIDGGA